MIALACGILHNICLDHNEPDVQLSSEEKKQLATEIERCNGVDPRGMSFPDEESALRAAEGIREAIFRDAARKHFPHLAQ